MEPEKFHLEVANPRDLRVLKMIQVGVAKLKGITNLDDDGGIFSHTCDAIGSHSVVGEDIAPPSVEEFLEAWAREFPDLDGKILMSKEESAEKMVSLFNFDGEDEIDGVEAELGVSFSVS